MAQSKFMHLATDLSFAHCSFNWRWPGAWSGYSYYGADFYEEVARIASRGVMDLLFFGDAADTSSGHGGNHDAAVKWGMQWPKHDMTVMAPLLARTAPGFGIGLTMSTTYHHPFHVARLFNSLDHLTGGRIAWNAVTSAFKNEAANWGFDPMMPHADRYERAHEHIKVVQALWDSVERDAIIMDMETGVFADPAKVHRIDHTGKYFTLPGPLPVLPSPQGRPVIVQAGQSPAGMDLCASFADVQFVGRRSLETMKAHRADLDARLIAKGRDPRDVGVLWSIRVATNQTKEQVLENERAWNDSLPPGIGVMMMSSVWGVDFGALPGDMKLAEAADALRAQVVHTGVFEEIIKIAGPDITLDDYGKTFLGSGYLVCGTPRQIADQLEELHEATGRNGGIIISPRAQPTLQFLRDFCEQVVPELQRRGLSKTRYAGKTLRENMLT
jgi:FMN-dependent oxidoreductase (nitrilotriacetate monooxygenase family)